MSTPEVIAPVVAEPTAAPAATETTAAAEITTSAQADQATATTDAVADSPATEGQVAAPVAAESSPSDDMKAPEAKSEEKKEKKQGRKPFADLINKILKPHPQDKSVTEKKAEAEAPAAVEEAVPEAAVPATEAPAAEPEATAEAPEAAAATEAAAAIDAPAEAVSADDAAKEVTTPRKERGNIFEKFTAFVLKPKSPKCKKADTPKEDGEESKTEAPAAEINADAQPAEDAAPSSPEVAAPETAETPAAETAVNNEAPEEVKAEKKEKTPKDLAKLARRFSGRLFGADKKKESPKKPEPTPEEVEATVQPETTSEAVATSDAAPQIAAETIPEVTQSPNDSAPVIAAAA